jgi:hypothetical protein
MEGRANHISLPTCIKIALAQNSNSPRKADRSVSGLASSARSGRSLHRRGTYQARVNGKVSMSDHDLKERAASS